MFQSRTTTQCREKEIVWDDGVVFLLSLCPKEGKAEELKVHCKEDTALICPEGQINVQEPCFGPQKYYDAREGLTYELELSAVECATVVYQHKDWGSGRPLSGNFPNYQTEPRCFLLERRKRISCCFRFAEKCAGRTCTGRMKTDS